MHCHAAESDRTWHCFVAVSAVCYCCQHRVYITRTVVVPLCSTVVPWECTLQTSQAILVPCNKDTSVFLLSSDHKICKSYNMTSSLILSQQQKLHRKYTVKGSHLLLPPSLCISHESSDNRRMRSTHTTSVARAVKNTHTDIQANNLSTTPDLQQ